MDLLIALAFPFEYDQFISNQKTTLGQSRDRMGIPTERRLRDIESTLKNLTATLFHGRLWMEQNNGGPQQDQLMELEERNDILKDDIAKLRQEKIMIQQQRDAATMQMERRDAEIESLEKRHADNEARLRVDMQRIQQQHAEAEAQIRSDLDKANDELKFVMDAVHQSGFIFAKRTLTETVGADEKRIWTSAQKAGNRSIH